MHVHTLEMATQNLEEVLEAIRAVGSHLNTKKCMLFKREVELLRHIVSSEGVATELAKVAAVRQWPTPCKARKVP